MPAFATHYLFMKDLLPWVGEEFNAVPDVGAMSVGTQGPDIFFFSRLLPLTMPGTPKSKIGSALHRAKPGDILDAFRDYCSFSPNIYAAKSYMYGFIMHYALDRVCHPYVYAFQGRILAKYRYLHRSSAHNQVEMAMDTCLIYDKLGYDNPFDFDGASTFSLSDEAVDEIAHLLAFVVPRVTSFTVTESDVRHAIADTARFQRILRDRSGMLRLVCRAAETILAPAIGYYRFSSNIKPKDLEKSKKYANINNGRWRSPFTPHEEHNESFYELYDIALQDAKNLICGFDKMFNGETNGGKVTKNISFLTGTEV